MRMSPTNVATGIIVAGAVILTGMNGVTGYRRVTRKPAAPLAVHAEWQSYFAGGILIGKAEARVKLVVFNDYLCPACRKFHPIVREVLTQHQESIAVVYRQLPRRFDSTAILSSQAAYCAHAAGHFRSFNDYLFGLSALHRDSLSRYAAIAEIQDTTSFARCISSSWASSAVRSDSLLAARLGTDGTPTILVNNEEFRGIPFGFQRILRRHLDSAYHLAR